MENSQVNLAPEKITNKDLWNMYFWWYNTYRIGCSYTRQDGIAFGITMIPILKKLYKNKEDLAAAIKRESTFYITEVGFGAIIHGLAVAMEEQKANGAPINDEDIIAVKSGLMGPLAGFGDSVVSVVQGVLRAVFVPLALEGQTWAVAVAYAISQLWKWPLGWIMILRGRAMGTAAVAGMLNSGMFKKIMAVASVLSMMIMGSMTASYVKLTTTLEITAGESVFAIQDFLDKALPGVLVIGPVLIFNWLMNKKVSMTKIIIGVAVVSLIGSFLGIF